MINREIYKHLWQEDIAQKPMVFISGPRQVGKTTLARDIIGSSYKNFEWVNLIYLKYRGSILMCRSPWDIRIGKRQKRKKAFIRFIFIEQTL